MLASRKDVIEACSRPKVKQTLIDRVSGAIQKTADYSASIEETKSRKLQEDIFSKLRLDGDQKTFWQSKREQFQLIQPHKVFENFIMLLIFTSSIMLTIDSPLNDPES